MSRNTTYLLIAVFIFAFCLSNNGVYAFGAGNIPSFAYMEGRAFRHGDIEDALAELIKRTGGGISLANILHKGHKFNGLDIKRVYFGNWLRDYSQAVDIAALKKLSHQTIINLCMALGFMAHGYATNEFEVTPERLGCYLPTEHIDNPKGYGAGDDPKKYHPGLRGPVDPRELEIDPRTGMKNYIANESGHWDTSKALVRRLLEQCIHLGRQNRATGQKQDEYEAFRLLGTALHTLEDFPAHSNFVELVLIQMGKTDVFAHVGDQIRVQAPNGKWVAPIVTGTFGSDDFFHSLLGEASDHLASVSDLNKELEKARSKQQSTRGPNGQTVRPIDTVADILNTIPGGSEMTRDLDSVARASDPAMGGKNPDEMSPRELHDQLWKVLTVRDAIVKKISKTIEKIPGLGPLIEKLMDSLSVFVFTTIEPFLKPILKSATAGLQDASAEVVNSHDQYEVFNDPRASDPTHSFLSKDHFNLILNEPAGLLAKVIVVNTVQLVSKAWDDNSVNVRTVTEDILQSLFHPDFHNNQSKIQREMLQCVHDWYNKLGKRQSDVIRRLSKNAVRNHENIRLSGEGGAPASEGSITGYAQSHIPGFNAAQGMFGSGGPSRDGQPGGGYPGAPPMGHSFSEPAQPAGEASSYYGGGSAAPSHNQSSGHGAYAAPGSISAAPSYGGGAAPSHTPPAHHVAAGYAPSYGRPSGGQSAAGGHHASGPSFPAQGGPPSFPGAAPSFPGGDHGPSFPGAAPAFSGASGYGGGGPGGFGGPPPSFPGEGGGYGGGYGGSHGGPPHGGPPHGGPPQPFGFPGADPYQPDYPGQHPPPGGHPPHGHHGGPPSFPGAPGGW
ncbi:heterokaryon incompatibility protein Het-C-domain-containing protein [Ephemerocybe angulata]|uniref:Heterokaryon incompatibility protein Het-C-domain-containing protein n=1 Tax=Ephemerocybe angulata TaxID=980116 RepID=A0A8H6HEN5_9AGAR|nr:heterokaryon incompatibility protein Het-C-domain-containing protein [Tulosesus angulatus]